MFGARLHPYRPEPRVRMALERLGLLLRSVRVSEGGTDLEALAAGLARKELLLLGDGGPEGLDDPMLAVLAAERAGREGFRAGMALAAHSAALTVLRRWTAPERFRQTCSELASAAALATLPLSWQRGFAAAAAGIEGAADGPPCGRLSILPSGCQMLVLFAAASETPRAVKLWLGWGKPAAGGTRCDLEPGALERLEPLEPPVGVSAELAAADALLRLMLGAAAACIGALSDALAVVQQHCLRAAPTAADTTPQVDQGLAEAGVLLESLRALSYAAADALRTWQSNANHGVLAEVGPLVASALWFARRYGPLAAEALGSVARQVAGAVPERLRQRQDELHLLAGTTVDDPTLEQLIARFYR